MKKIIKLTERELTNIIKRVIKEQSFASGSDDPGNEVYEEYYETIIRMYEEIGEIDNLDDLEYMMGNFYGLAKSISRDEDLNDDDADELIDMCSDVIKQLEDMEYDFYNDDFEQINELDRSTYMKASDAANKKGLKGLARKFRSHGDEKGLNPNKDVIEFVSVGTGSRDVESIKFRIVDIVEEDENNYTLKLEGAMNSMPASIQVHLTLFKLTFSHSSRRKIFLKTRKDARILLKAFEDNGINVSNIDPRQISFEDTGL